jgi:hypothetical protein
LPLFILVREFVNRGDFGLMTSLPFLF